MEDIVKFLARAYILGYISGYLSVLATVQRWQEEGASPEEIRLRCALWLKNIS
jgi:hypothetical protein